MITVIRLILVKKVYESLGNYLSSSNFIYVKFRFISINIFSNSNNISIIFIYKYR